MSRKPSNAATRISASNPPAPTMSLSNRKEEQCPICKRSTYLNHDMVFLINPECYHRICNFCVESIFKSGPAQCPYASCTKTLRQKGFRRAYFEDLSVEREVDIRKRVAAVFNKQEDDFVDLRAFNDYLQDVEDLTFDLLEGGERERKAAEQKLLHYEASNKSSIEANKRRGRDAETARKARAAADAEAARLRRIEEAKEEAAAKEEEAKLNAEVMDALARGNAGRAAEIQEKIVAANKAKVARLAGEHFAAGADAPPSLLSIRGLRDRKAERAQREWDEDKPYDPFEGLDLAGARYEVHDEYENPWLEDARSRDDHRVPGYSVKEYVARAMFEAFAGLGVAIEDEKGNGIPDLTVTPAPGDDTASRGDASTGLSVKMEDVFV